LKVDDCERLKVNWIISDEALKLMNVKNWSFDDLNVDIYERFVNVLKDG